MAGPNALVAGDGMTDGTECEGEEPWRKKVAMVAPESSEQCIVAVRPCDTATAGSVLGGACGGEGDEGGDEWRGEWRGE